MYDIKITEDFAIVAKNDDLSLVIGIDEMLSYEETLSDNEMQMLLINYLQTNIRTDLRVDSFKLSTLELKVLCRMYDIKIIGLYARELLESRKRYEKNKSKTITTPI